MSRLTSFSKTFARLYARLRPEPNRRRSQGAKRTLGAPRRLLRIESLEQRELLSASPPELQPLPAGVQAPPAIVSAPDVSQYADAASTATGVDAEIAQMTQAVQAAIAQGSPQCLSALSTARVHVNSQGDIQLYVCVDAVTSDEVQALQSAGLQVEASDAEMGIVQGWASCSAIAQLGQTAGVEAIRAPDYAIPQAGDVDSAGDQILQASNVRSQFAAYGISGIDGTGIKVGVISSGIANWAVSHATGDLPSITIDRDRPGSSTSNEGTAMLEIVHDLAPGADLYFSGPQTPLDMSRSIDWLVNTEHCQVIVDDEGFETTASDPYFSDGNIATAAENAVKAGVVYVTAAGNWQSVYDGNTHSQVSSHWLGTFYDGGNGWNNFGTSTNKNLGNAVKVANNGTVTTELQWADQWGGSGNTYVLYLYDSTGNRLTYGTPQSSGVPMDDIYWKNTTGSTQTYYLEIRKTSGVARDLEMFTSVTGGSAMCFTTLDSLVIQHAAQGVISVGAMDSQAGPPYTTVEPFSDGGQTEFYNYLTQKYSLVNTLAGCGVDDVNTEIGEANGGNYYFANPFYGTSAAAAEVAAIAALMLQTNPSLTPNAVACALDNTATAVGGAYTDRAGCGLFNALNAVYNVFTPDAPYLDPASQSDPQSSNATAVADPTIDGAAPLGSYVALYVDGTLVNSEQLGSSQSTYSIATGTLSAGTHQIRVRVGASSTTPVANLSNRSSIFSLTIYPELYWAGTNEQEWDATTADWCEGSPTGQSTTWINGAIAVFTASATVSIEPGFTPQPASLTFSAPAGSTTYIQGSGLTLPASPNATITVSANTSVIINSAIEVGQVGCEVLANGTLALAGTNTYTGATSVLSGRTIVTSPNGLPDGSDLNVGPDSSIAFPDPLLTETQGQTANLTTTTTDGSSTGADQTADYDGLPRWKAVVTAFQPVLGLLEEVVAPGQTSYTSAQQVAACSIAEAAIAPAGGTSGAAFDAALTAGFQAAGLTVTPCASQAAAAAAAASLVGTSGDSTDHFCLMCQAVVAYMADNAIQGAAANSATADAQAFLNAENALAPNNPAHSTSVYLETVLGRQ